MIHDFCIIGGGIVGLATAMELLKRQPGASLVILEKESVLAKHQTGHNSGVIHAGIYYAPGSLKADLCKRGAEATKQFCREHGIKFEVCGKLLVASSPLEMQRMEALYARAQLNGMQVERLNAEQLCQREPNIVGLGGLFLDATGIVDYRQVCETMAQVIRRNGGQICLERTVTAIHENTDTVTVNTEGEITDCP